jgi:hypothetical protein
MGRCFPLRAATGGSRGDGVSNSGRYILLN